jgi:hypothetical protein
MDFLRFTFRDPPHFIGMIILIWIPLKFIHKFVYEILRHWNVRKHGYPPEHCDADGDFRPMDKKDEDA